MTSKPLQRAIRKLVRASCYEIGCYDAMLAGSRSKMPRPRLRHLKHVAERRLAIISQATGVVASKPCYYWGRMVAVLPVGSIEKRLTRIENFGAEAATLAAAEPSMHQLEVTLRKCVQDIALSR